MNDVSDSPQTFGRAVFAGCARNCAAHLPGVLENIAGIATLFSEVAFVFVENDSQDATLQVLKDAAARTPNFTVISLEGFAARVPERTIRLAEARNRCLDVVRAKYRKYDYLFVLDCDEVNETPIDPQLVVRALTLLRDDPKMAGLFSNYAGPYYDMWALRHKEICPSDVWEAVCDEVFANRMTDAAAFKRQFESRLFGLRPETPPVEIDSAFGGLGIYKVGKALKNRRRYVGSKPKTFGPYIKGGWQMCEHVSFNLGLRENGDTLYIAPFLINYVVRDLQFNPSAWRTMMFIPPDT